LHITVTAAITVPDVSHTLLIRHRRSGRWQPPGGHLEPADGSLSAAAEREAVEETGVTELAPRGMLALRPGVTTCHPTAAVHVDAVFGFVAPGLTRPRTSAEVLACAWFACQDLPEPMAPDTREVLRQLALTGGPAGSAAWPAEST
jgi:8-oxo-dGTP pyrophosphatase MutT (NUDIX family)